MKELKAGQKGNDLNLILIFLHTYDGIMNYYDGISRFGILEGQS